MRRLHFLFAVVCCSIECCLAIKNVPTIISAPSSIDNDLTNHEYSVDEMSGSDENAISADDQYRIGSIDRYFSLFGINRSSIDPDIIQEAFMTTVIPLFMHTHVEIVKIYSFNCSTAPADKKISV